MQQAVQHGRHDEALRSIQSLSADAAAYSADINLQLASLATLYRAKGLEPALRCVAAAERARAEGGVLYQALKGQLDALNGKPGSAVRKQVKTALASAEPLAVFHAASALVIAGDVRRVARTLAQLDPNALPAHLEWRFWSLRGEMAVQQRRFEEAVSHFEAATRGAPETDRTPLQFALAECWLHLSRPDEALTALGDSLPPLEELDQQVRGHYLLGVTQRQLANYDSAFKHLQRAASMAESHGVPFELLQELARYYAETGEPENAVSYYDRAVKTAPAPHKPYIRHEYGRVLKDYDYFSEAQTILKQVLAQTRYPQRPEVSAELAEINYYLGKFNRVEPLAQFALRGGVTASACLSLGRVALEYFRLDESESWLEQCVSASTPGDRSWLTAQLLLVETFAHQLDTCPEKLKYHAEQALKYLHPNDDWVVTLNGYLASADKALKGQARVVN